MLTTLELRWFNRGTLPADVENWFQTDSPGKLLGSPERREDFYLYTPNCDYLNIKLRQGSLEVKWRKAQLGILRFSSGWQGNVEKWLKWSCQDPTEQSIMPVDVVGQQPWISVHKVRSQRLYQKITFELTQLTVKNDHWWSIAFEVITEEINQLDTFERLVSQVAKTYRSPELLVNQSYAYPHWLSLVA